jgi:hypothetical protein
VKHQKLFRGTWENNETLGLNIRSPGRDLNVNIKENIQRCGGLRHISVNRVTINECSLHTHTYIYMYVYG